MALIQRFITVFGKDSIAGIMGDREFIGKRWFQYLKDNDLTFYFRVKKDADTTNANGKSVSISWLFYHLPRYQPRVISKPRPVYGHKLYITGMRIEDDYLIVVSNRKPEGDVPDQTIKIYAIQWEIETLFSCLKSKGFNFEDTHITHRVRIKKLIAVLAMGFCWAHLTGEWRHQHEKTIRIKKHGRPSMSLFRYGLDLMNPLICLSHKKRARNRVHRAILQRTQ